MAAPAGGRALWRGTLGFGLIQIPIVLLPAEQTHELAFHELDKRDMSRIGYERISKSTGKPVEWKDVVKGYEIEKGRFVVLDPEDFKKANVAATQSIDILDFVEKDAIPPTYFERPYYVLPDRRGEKAYAVLHEALGKKGYVAIGLVVIRTRQHLCAVVPLGGGLVLELLRFAHELRPAQKASPAAKASPKEVALAEQLIEGMASAWDPKKYRDSYSEDLLAAIRQKDEKGHVRPSGVPAARTVKLTDLSELLRKSLAVTKKGARHGRPTRRAKAAA